MTPPSNCGLNLPRGDLRMSPTANCDLCGSSLGRSPRTRKFDEVERDFCCAGCLNVYSILVESGLAKPGLDLRETDLFRQSRRLGLIATPEDQAQEPPRSLSDDRASTRETLFQIGGMWCASCAWLIERALLREPGVRAAEVFFASDLLRVTYLPQSLRPGRIEQRISELGYKCWRYSGQSETDLAERRDLLLRLGVAGFVWLNIMYLSMVFYVGYFEQVAQSARRILPFVLMGLSAPAVFYSAFPILRVAWLGLCERTVRVESLLALGILSAWFYSSAQAVRAGPHYYFDTACAIVTLVLAGKLIERNARDRTSSAISALYRMMPLKARVIRGDNERFIPLEELQRGTVFVVKAGETIPADGVVVEGNSHVDESLLTGESAPVEKAPDAAVVCGSTNGDGVLKVRTLRAAGDSTLSRIIRMVETAMSTRSNLERRADRISRVFVPTVIIVAILTFGAALTAGDAGSALMRAVTVLVVACPCALGIATPLAVTAAVGVASRRGILVSDPRFLEAVERLDVVLMDKTGTVTEGTFTLLGFSIADECDEPEIAFVTGHLPLLAALERYSEHPLGRALTEYASSRNVPLGEAAEIVAEAGCGLRGRVDGHAVFAGSRSLAECAGALPHPCLERATEEWARAGHTIVWYGWDGIVRGVLAFGDRVRPRATGVVTALKRWGMRVWVVSGDTPLATAHAASVIGADDYRAACMPGEKERVIRDLQSGGASVAMIGDGVNDAPALAQADLGIAMGSGTDIAMRAAPVTLISADLGRIPVVFALARKTVRIVRENLFWAFLYNVAGIALAVTGVLSPIAAAVAMILSSISVILNSLRVQYRLDRGLVLAQEPMNARAQRRKGARIFFGS